MFAGSYRRVPFHGVGRRQAPNRPLINFLFVLIALVLIYICCVLISVFRTQSTPVGTGDDPRITQPFRSDQHLLRDSSLSQVDSLVDDDDEELDSFPPPTPPPPQHKVAHRAQSKSKQSDELPMPPDFVRPNRTRADSMRYGVCAASAYSVPDFGPLYLLERGPHSSCAVYLYPALYGLSRPILPRLPPLNAPPLVSATPDPPQNPPGPQEDGPDEDQQEDDPDATDVGDEDEPELPDRRPLSRESLRVSSAIASEEQRLSGQRRALQADRFAQSQPHRGALADSDVATGVLASAVDLAAEEQLNTATLLEGIAGLRTPPATASLPPDIGHWTHVQLQKARDLQTAWLANDTVTQAALPHSVALLKHPARRALTKRFAEASACVLKHVGGAAAAAAGANVSADAAPKSVLSWPQVLSYDAPERMPTGRETSLPRALLRGVYIARVVGSVMIDMYDPRGPLDSMEVQDMVSDMYKIELKTGDLLILPPWVQTSILVVPPLPQDGANGDNFTGREPPDHVAAAVSSGLDLGFAAGFDAPEAPPLPRTAGASVIHLALPGDAPTTAGTVLPLHVRPEPRSPKPGTGKERSGAPPVLHKPEEPAAEEEEEAGVAEADGGVCDVFNALWYMYGSPVSVHNLAEVDPLLDLGELRRLAKAAWDAFRRCFPDDGNDAEHEIPGSLGDDLFAYQSHWPNAEDFPCTGGLKGAAAKAREREWQEAYLAYTMGEMHERMLTAVSTVVVSLLQGVSKADMAEEMPGIFSWLTVHDVSTSFHGRHYHRDQGMTAVLYISDPAPDSAPLEFSNPIVGPDSVPNGRVTFKPQKGDFVIFPSFLSHTVPMRHLQDTSQPRISIAFNIWFRGPGLERYAEGMSESDRDEVGPHQYVSMSDVVLDDKFRPRQGLDL